MMQRHGGAADLFHQRFTFRPQFFQIRRTKLRVSRSRKNQICHREIAHRPIVGSRERIDFLRDAQRCFANFVRRPCITNDRGINTASCHDYCIIADLRASRGCESGRNHNVRISRANEEAELLQRVDLFAQLHTRVAQLVFALRCCRLYFQFAFDTR